jgi:GNAT superfamily N-acetyltransferase
MLKLSPINKTHLDEIVQLITGRYGEMLLTCLLLPDRFTKPDVVRPMLETIITSAPGVAAYKNRKLAGFMTGWLINEFRGQPAVFCPEWANATSLEDSRSVYEAMYEYSSRIWLDEGYRVHYISQYPDRPNILNAWFWLGFGLCAADGVRDLQPLNKSPSIKIKRAQIDDLSEVIVMVNALSQHIAESPTYLYSDEQFIEKELVTLLSDPAEAFWLAYLDSKVVGYLKHGPASDNASQIIVDPGTTSIRGCYTVPEARNKGVAASLLDHALAYSKSSGYSRCCVDWEPMNVIATRFWTRYFQIVSLSMVRHIDPRFSQ